MIESTSLTINLQAIKAIQVVTVRKLPQRGRDIVANISYVAQLITWS